MQPGRKLFRSQTDRIFAGVCGGLAEYFAVDAVFVRLLYAAITVFTGVVPGLVVYVLAILIVPPGPLPVSANVNPTPPEPSSPEPSNDA